MTLLGCVLFVVMLACFEKVVFVCLLLFLNVFTLFFFFFLSIFSCLCVKIPKTHKKVENPKCLIGIVVFCHKHFLPCTFVQMALCIYECNLFSMHSYHCGKNLEIYVIVVNRSSNLSWMISQWFCWSWDMHRLMPIYLPTLLFYCFA